MRAGYITIILIILAILAVSSCIDPLPRPPCPDFNKIQQNYGRQEDFGQPAQHSGKASVEINFIPSYIVELVRSRISAPDISAMKQGDSGMDIGRIRLEEKGTGATRVNLISISFSVWLKGQDGNKVFLPSRNYTLRLRFEPYLITPATIPDSTKRRAVLGCRDGDPDCGDSGVILALRFYELTGGGASGTNEPVDCKSSSYDYIDEKVLTEAYNISVQQEPIRIPAETITKLITDLVNAPVTFTEMDLGTDQYLKIGLVVDQGTPMNFDPTYSELVRHPGTHWGISIDRNLITPAIQRNIDAEIQANSANLESPPQVAYTRDGFVIDLTARKPWGLCGDVRFSVNARAKPAICRNSAGNSSLRLCQVSSAPSPLWASFAQAACVGISEFFNGVINCFKGGISEACINCPCSPGTKCSEFTELQFSMGSDVLYATQIDTDDFFFIAGRSQFMDSRSTDSPPSLPSCSNVQQNDCP